MQSTSTMNMIADVDAVALQRLLDEQAGFSRAYNFVVTSVGPGTCTLLAKFDADHERPGGVISGPLFMAAADVTMWLAIKTLRGLDDPSLTVSLDTQFLRAARREDVFCVAHVLDLGERDCFGTAQCQAADGRVFTHHALRYRRPKA